MSHTVPGPSPLFCSFIFLYSESSSGRTAMTDRALGRGSEVTTPQTSGPEGAEREEEETGALKGAGGGTTGSDVNRK